MAGRHDRDQQDKVLVDKEGKEQKQGGKEEILWGSPHDGKGNEDLKQENGTSPASSQAVQIKTKESSKLLLLSANEDDNFSAQLSGNIELVARFVPTCLVRRYLDKSKADRSADRIMPRPASCKFCTETPQPPAQPATHACIVWIFHNS